MLRYIAKRIFLMIPVLLGISFVIFLLMYFTPGDPAQMILGDLATKEEVEALREEMGLNDGFFERYFRYMGDLLKGDLGTSYTTKVPVWDEISARLPVTAKVAFFVIIFAVLIGVPIGILSAVRQYTIIDSITRVMALLGITMPSFWFALLLVLLFSVKLASRFRPVWPGLLCASHHKHQRSFRSNYHAYCAFQHVGSNPAGLYRHCPRKGPERARCSF